MERQLENLEGERERERERITEEENQFFDEEHENDIKDRLITMIHRAVLLITSIPPGLMIITQELLKMNYLV